MRIGILTYHRAFNYGAFVQAYSLSDNLKKMFPTHTVEIIDFSYKYDIVKKHINHIKTLLKRGPKALLSTLRLEKEFSKDMDRMLLGKRIITNNTVAAIKKIEDEYDLIIVGSDAVFNWTLNPIPNVYFFDSDNCVHITYAASCHLNRYLECTKDEHEYIKKAFSKFAYIGVRDYETEKMVKHFANIESYHNCDPTVVLNFDFDTPELVSKLREKGIKPDEKIIFVMLKKQEYAREIKEKYGSEYKIIALRNHNDYADVLLDNLSPLEWSRVFQFGTITVTDYFHGSLLSIKNGVPVISIDSSGYCGLYESKAKDLFYNRLKIPEFYFEVGKNKSIIQVCDKILSTDYSKQIKNAIEEEKQSFFEFCNDIRKFIE